MTNARKSREKHRMEEATIAEQQFEQERIKAMVEANEVFECSGTQVHNQSCEGDCNIRHLDPLEIEINEERKKWELAGMLPMGVPQQLGGMVPGVPIDILQTSIALAALTEAVYDLGVDKDELNNKYRQMYLERLRTIREANEEAVAAAQNRSGIEIVQDRKQLIVPDHIARKMH